MLIDKTQHDYYMWLLWHGDNPSMTDKDYMDWIDARDLECTEPRFDEWLRNWVRREMAMKVMFGHGL